MSKNFKVLAVFAFVVLVSVGGYVYQNVKNGNLSSSADGGMMPYNSRVYGSVVDQDGKPIAGVKVSVVVHKTSQYEGIKYYKTDTNSTGNYSFTVQGPVNFDLLFNHSMYYDGAKKGISVGANTQYEVKPAFIMQLIGMNNGDIFGYVKDQLGNKIVGATVEITSGSGFYQTQTTRLPDGMYTTDGQDAVGLPAGYFTLTVYHPSMDYANPGQNKATVSVGKDQTVQQDFKINLKLSGPRL